MANNKVDDVIMVALSFSYLGHRMCTFLMQTYVYELFVFYKDVFFWNNKYEKNKTKKL